MEKFMTIKELAEAIKISTRSIYNLVYKGRIPHYKIGGSLRFSEKEIKRRIKKYPMS